MQAHADGCAYLYLGICFWGGGGGGCLMNPPPPPGRPANDTIRDRAMAMIPLPEGGPTQDWRMKDKNDGGRCAAPLGRAHAPPGQVKSAFICVCVWGGGGAWGCGRGCGQQGGP